METRLIRSIFGWCTFGVGATWTNTFMGKAMLDRVIEKAVHVKLDWHPHNRRSQLDKGHHVETRLFSLHFAMKLWTIPWWYMEQPCQ